MNSKYLVWQFWGFILFSIALVLLTFLKTIPCGVFFNLGVAKHYIEMVHIVIVLSAVVLSLRMSKQKQKNTEQSIKNKHFMRNRALSIWILGSLLVISAIFYNLFISTQYAYIAAILCIAMFFIYPYNAKEDEINDSNSKL